MSTKLKVLSPDVERSAMTDEQLFKRLADRLLPTADNLMQMAGDWAELERRGHELSGLRNGLGEWLPLIAARRLAPEAVVAFRGHKLILKHLDGMKLETQRRLADGEPIPVYLPGEKNPASMALAEIPPAALPWVIVNGEIQTPAGQRLVKTAGKKPVHLVRKHRVKVDRSTRSLKIGNTVVGIETVIAAMSEAAGAKGLVIDSIEAPAKTIAGKVTDEEKERLRAAAKAHGLEEWEMVRQAVVVMWML